MTLYISVYKNKFNRIKKCISKKAKYISLKFSNFLNYIKNLIYKINWSKLTSYALFIFKKVTYYIRSILSLILYILWVFFFSILFIISAPHRYTIRFMKYVNHKLAIVFLLIFLGFIYFNFYRLPFGEAHLDIMLLMIIYLYIASVLISLLIYFIYIYKFAFLIFSLLSFTWVYKTIYDLNFWLKYSIVYPMTPKEFFTFLVYIALFYTFFKIFEGWYYKRIIILGLKNCTYNIALLTLGLLILLTCIHFLTFESRAMLAFFIFLVFYYYVLIRCCVKAYAKLIKNDTAILLFNWLKFFLGVYILLKVIGIYPINCHFEPSITLPTDLVIKLQTESFQYTLDAIPDNLKLDLINKSLEELSLALEMVNKFAQRKELEYVFDLHKFLNSNCLDVTDLWNNLTRLLHTKFELFRLQIFRGDVEHFMHIKM